MFAWNPKFRSRGLTSRKPRDGWPTSLVTDVAVPKHRWDEPQKHDFERSQTRNHCMIPSIYTKCPGQVNPERKPTSGAGVGGAGGACWEETGVLYRVMKMFWNWNGCTMLGMDCMLLNCTLSDGEF